MATRSRARRRRFWAASLSGGGSAPTPMTFGMSSGTSGGGVSGAADQTHLYRMALTQAMRVTKLAYRSGSQSATTGQYRLVIYSHIGSAPAALLAQTAVTAETVGSGINTEVDLVAPVTLQPGDYWLGIQMGGQAVELDSVSTALALGRGHFTDTFSDGPLATAGAFTSFGAGLALKIWATGTTA